MPYSLPEISGYSQDSDTSDLNYMCDPHLQIQKHEMTMIVYCRVSAALSRLEASLDGMDVWLKIASSVGDLARASP